MITFSFVWHLLVFIVIIVAELVWALTRDLSDDGWGIKAVFVWGFYTAITLLTIAIYGGIYWW